MLHRNISLAFHFKCVIPNAILQCSNRCPIVQAALKTQRMFIMPVQSIEKLTVVAKDNVDAFTKSSNQALSGIQSLVKAYQDLITRNFEKQAASFQTLSSVKTPDEFVKLQQKLVTEAIETAIADGRVIAELTTSIFTAIFEPVQKQVAAVQSIVKKAA